MKKYNFIILITMMLISINSFNAQEDSELQKEEVSDYVFDVYLLNGYALAYNLFSNSGPELRLTFDLYSSFSNSTADNKNESFYSDNTSSSDLQKIDSEYGYHNFNISVQYLLNLYNSKIGTAYYGIGPIVGYELRKSTSEYESQNSTSESTSTRDMIAAGIINVLGIRSKISTGLSVFAEMQLTGGKRWTTYKENYDQSFEGSININKRTVEENSWFYELSYVRLGIRLTL